MDLYKRDEFLKPLKVGLTISQICRALTVPPKGNILKGAQPGVPRSAFCDLIYFPYFI